MIPAGRLLNSTGTELANDQSFPNFRINALLDRGTYYIEVHGSGRTHTGDYDLHVEVVTATEIGLNTSRSETIDPLDDVDYFSIVISTPTFVNIFTTEDVDTAGILLDDTGAELAFDDDQSDDEVNFLIRTRLNKGTYYIQVMSSSSEEDGPYVLHVDIDDVEDDHSDTIAAATEIELDTSRSGTINFAGDVDYFSIVISTPTFVNIFTTSDLDTDGFLRLNNTFSGIIFNNDPIGPSNRNFLISTRIDSGTHSIRVRAPSGGTGDYTLYVLTDDHGSTIEAATTLTLNTTSIRNDKPCG